MQITSTIKNWFKRTINWKIDGKIFFDLPEEKDTRTYENIRKIATGQGDDYTTDCLLDYPSFKEII